MMQPLLEVSALSVGFATEAGVLPVVRDLSFRLGRGETLVIVGESGSGKSVTCLALMGLLPQPAGRISGGAMRLSCKDGTVRDLAQLPPHDMQRVRGAEIAMIFQEPMTSLNPVYTIGEQIVEAVRFHETISPRAARARAAEMLALLGMPDPVQRLGAYPHQLSGGMRQRAMIGMALACRPALLIADEPTTALDVTVQAQILDLLRRLQRELGMAIIFITHNLGVAAEIADNILVMYAGQAVETGPRNAIFTAPRQPYTMGLLHVVPRLGLDRTAGLLHLPPGCAFQPRCSFARPGLCDEQSPVLESCDENHAARCLRWREIAAA